MTPALASRIAGFSVTTPDAERLMTFYSSAFGVATYSSERLAGYDFERCMGVSGGAWRHVMPFGNTFVEFLQFDTPGRPYPYTAPGSLSPDDTIFQHFAIIVSDMPRAMATLGQAQGWVPLTHGGPQQLPPRSGAVTAFKFQDPDGHPLELLAFPSDAAPAEWPARAGASIFWGIDHSAISVRDTAASTRFYAALGFQISAQTQNQGIEQAALDGMPDPHVEVTALSLQYSTPHLELLCYRRGQRAGGSGPASNDVAAARVLLLAEPADGSAEGGAAGSGAATRDAARIGAALASGTATSLLDPDGHHLLIVSGVDKP